ncbi:MAG: hypothetical protein HY763_16700 [Planctomycetes bacterium]|nr:hypothetical protein [Planctomycetota bacterium]
MSIRAFASRADDATAVPGAIYAFVGDHALSRFETNADRADMVPVIPPAHGTPGEASADVTVEWGRTATLIAAEGLGGTLLSRSDDSAPFTAEVPPDATEFLSWEVDVDSIPEAGLRRMGTAR